MCWLYFFIDYLEADKTMQDHGACMIWQYHLTVCLVAHRGCFTLRQLRIKCLSSRLLMLLCVPPAPVIGAVDVQWNRLTDQSSKLLIEWTHSVIQVSFQLFDPPLCWCRCFQSLRFSFGQYHFFYNPIQWSFFLWGPYCDINIYLNTCWFVLFFNI